MCARGRRRASEDAGKAPNSKHQHPCLKDNNNFDAVRNPLMNVHPSIITHAKFLILKRDLQELGRGDALEILVRIWGHCQLKQLGENWGKVSPEYVEAIAGWSGESGALFRILTKPFCGKPGWVSLRRSREVIITSWNEHNEYLVNAWNNGRKGGRPKGASGKPGGFPDGNPRATGRQPDGKAIGVGSLESGIGDGELGEGGGCPPAEELAQVPTVEEVVAFGLGAAGIPEGYCRHYHAKCEEQHRWIKNGRLIEWRKELPRWWAGDRASWKERKTAAGVASAEEIAQLEAELDAESRPEKIAELRGKLKKARGE